MSEEVAAAPAAEVVETPEVEAAESAYVAPDDADEFVPTKWNKTPPEYDEDVEEEPVAVEEEVEEEADEFLKPDGQMIMMKIDGKELPMPLEKVVAAAQKAHAGEQRMQEAATLKKQVVNLMHGLKNNPFSVLARPEFGLDEQELRNKAEEWLYDRVTYEQMSDEEKAKADKMKKLEALEREKEEWEKQKKEEQTKAYKDHYSQKIMEALDASELPKKPQVIKRIAFYLGEGLRKGVRLDPKDVIPFVKKDMIEDYRALTKDEKALSALMDEETMDLVKKKSLDNAKKPKLAKPTKQGNTVDKPWKPKKKMGLREFRERNKSILYGND